MPIYEYRCASCGHELEALQKFSDAPLLTCPSCKADALVKRVSAAGFQLKGTGWYATDFKSGTGKTAKADGGEAKPGANPEATPAGEATTAKAETKAEAKAGAAAPVAGTGGSAAST